MKGKKILIVDDAPDVRKILEKVFRDAGAETLIAADGAEGLRYFFSEKPDLVILDVMMPEVDSKSAIVFAKYRVFQSFC